MKQVRSATLDTQSKPFEPGSRHAGFKDYLTIARFDHATKHLFIVPGIVIAYALRGSWLQLSLTELLIGLLSAVAIASANYVINEWLDREFDKFHPLKSARTAVQCQLSPAIVLMEYALLLVMGLAFASTIGSLFFGTSILFALSGVVYNVEPLRTKDRAYLDVISESINNPIRLMLGWTMVDGQTLPPSSLLLAYWAGGAFLMGAKRLSEYRDISVGAGIATLGNYRRSFRYYTAETLTVSCLLYAVLASFFLAVFLIKYRLEYIIAFPFIAGLFACYFWLSLRPGSIAQRPERLFRSRRLMVAASCVATLLIVLTFVKLPFLTYLSEPSFVLDRLH